MPSVCFYFQVHQPYRIKKYSFFDIGNDPEYFNDEGDSDLNNEKIIKKVASKCYLPTNRILLQLLKEYPEFRFSFSFSGVALEQMEKHSPEVLQSFKDLIDTGRVEVLAETYHHSFAVLYSFAEFQKQVQMHMEKVESLFGVTPRIFRSTELSYSNDIAQIAESLGFDGVLGEGVDNVLGWRSPNFIYEPQNTEEIKLLLKNYRLSDDIAFRFSAAGWKEHPLTAEKFGQWISQLNGSGEVANLFMDYETFGEHQWEETGIFDFLRHLPKEILKHKDNDFLTLSGALERYPVRDRIDIPHLTSWADTERDLSAWIGNDMQKEAFHKLYEIEAEVLQFGDLKIMESWRRLQISDQFYYMSTKGLADGVIHNYFNPHESPYDAFIHFINALNDLKLRINKKNVQKYQTKKR